MAKKEAKKVEAVTEEPKVAKPVPEPKSTGTIDERMAALLEDHKRMGSRPR